MRGYVSDNCIQLLICFISILMFYFFFFAGFTVIYITVADESLDTRENTDLTLKCRFTEKYDAEDFTFYWARWTANPSQFENVAFGDVQLNSGYR